MQEFKGRIAVVTGGASGIGRALAGAFAGEGMKVALADVEAGALDKAAGELRARDGEREIPVLRANVLFRALALAPGEHRLELEFAPESWRIGGWISAGAALTTLALGAAALARKRSLSFATTGNGGA